MDLTEEEDAALREIFDAFDAVKSGAIDSRELTEGARLYGLNPTRTEVDTAWSSKDVDNSGTLSYDQFKTLVISMKKTDEQLEAELDEAVNTMMASLGLENMETMSKADFMEFVKTRGEDPLTNEEIDELFRDVDQDGDSDTLNRRELVAILTQKY